MYRPLLSAIYATCPTHFILLDFITQTILDEGCRSLNSLFGSFPHSHYLIPIRLKYSSQDPILKHPQPMFLSQCEWPSFTPIRDSSIHILNIK
jgi:hypothetical protein